MRQQLNKLTSTVLGSSTQLTTIQTQLYEGHDDAQQWSGHDLLIVWMQDVWGESCDRQTQMVTGEWLQKLRAMTMILLTLLLLMQVITANTPRDILSAHNTLDKESYCLPIWVHQCYVTHKLKMENKHKKWVSKWLPNSYICILGISALGLGFLKMWPWWIFFYPVLAHTRCEVSQVIWIWYRPSSSLASLQLEAISLSPDHDKCTITHHQKHVNATKRKKKRKAIRGEREKCDSNER